jgi:hypothetical protein
LPPRVGALLLFVVGAGAILVFCLGVEVEVVIASRGYVATWAREIWAVSNFLSFGLGCLRH